MRFLSGLPEHLTLWLGIMKIGENSGLISALARFLSPVLCRLFPEIPKEHLYLGSIFMNMSANMLGLDNAATPMEVLNTNHCQLTLTLAIRN